MNPADQNLDGGFEMGVIDWLDRLWALSLRELRAYFTSVLAWVAMTVFLAVNGLLFYVVIDAYSQPAQIPISGASQLFRFCLVLLTFLCPALTMHLVSAEWDDRTIEGLLTAPVTETQVAISKFVGAYGFFLTMLGSLGSFLLVLASLGQWESGPILSSFLGLMLIGALFLSFGLFASSLTRSQLVAFLLTFLFNIVLTWGVAMTERVVAPGTLARQIIESVMIERHFQDFNRGLVSSPAVAFYLSGTALLLFLTTRSLESRKWS